MKYFVLQMFLFNFASDLRNQFQNSVANINIIF